MVAMIEPIKSFLSSYPYRSSKEYQKKFKRVNHKWYGYVCDPERASNPSSFQMKFDCLRSQKEVETPLSATMILRANDGFELVLNDQKLFEFGVFESEKSDFNGSFFSFKMLSKRVQGIYFHWNRQIFKAGCTLFLEEMGIGNEINDQDRMIFMEFSSDKEFSKLPKSMKIERIPKVLDFEETDLKVLYAVRSKQLNDFVIFARNQKNEQIEQLVYNPSSFGFEKVQSDLEYNSEKNLKDGKLSLLFMTYDRNSEDVQTLTVYRTANGDIEKKILVEGVFDVLPKEPIVSRDEMVEYKEEIKDELENEYEIVSRPPEDDF
uniref:DUF4340 domain-containing protein n=2 Tax=Caenorhabditis tropicalis TaxID=1561998 RepID=A0A1I7UYJ1_9PELO